jgi:TetR/AcrR family transcriptional regulator, lmrAB and yxaGH operons repressor
MPPDTRTRMIEATIGALQRHGVAGMSFTEILAASGAARGAIYHHFPGGKTQLVAEAATRNGQDIRAQLAALPADTPQAVAHAFLTLVRPVMEASASGGGCAVAALTIRAEAGAATEELRQVADATLSSWTDQLTERLTTAGRRPDQASDLAVTLITLLEGAHVMCRAAGTVKPFDQAARTTIQLFK